MHPGFTFSFDKGVGHILLCTNIICMCKQGLKCSLEKCLPRIQLWVDFTWRGADKSLMNWIELLMYDEST